MKSRLLDVSFRLASIAGLSIALVWAMAATPHAQRGRGPLFGPPRAEAAAAVRDRRPHPRGVVRARRVAVDLPQVEGAAADLSLDLFDDTVFAAVLDRHELAPGGSVWVGRIRGVEMSNVTLSVVDGALAGTVSMPGGIYSIRYAGPGVHEIAQIDQSAFPSGRDVIPVGEPGRGAAAAADAAAADGGAVIDVMVVYTPAARNAADVAGDIAALINLGVSQTNTSYANSAVTQRIRLVRTAEVAYTEGDMFTDLENLRNGAGGFAGVDAMRSASGADLVMLLGDWPASPYCGYAYAMQQVGASFASSAFSAVDQSCVSTNFSFAHELGHNMGANHDWYMDSSVEPYTYAHGYVNPPGRWRTVMAYDDLCSALGVGCTRLLYWSNPAVAAPSPYQPAPMGIPAGTRSDCPIGDPFNVSCDADDHRVLNQTAPTVASFRPAVSPVAAPIALRFAARKAGAGGPLISVTPGQAVTVTTSNPSTSWTATADQPWIQLSPMSGTGAGQFTVSIVNPNNVLGASTNVSSTITVTPGTAGQVPASVTVTLTVDLSGTVSAAPFGQIDTPAQGASGVVGAIGVTGWALDDVGVASVRIYRNCLAFEPQNCQWVGGSSLVFVGTAAFLAGARPDVEAAFPSYPQANRGGWGYLMLTNMLPHVPGSQAYGGQGTLSFYAFAVDGEGQMTLLGRSQVDHTPTTISLANDTIAKPFGSIDTPGQGQVVSGVVANFGWALTPDANTAGGEAGDILLPVNGSTMTVFIDGAPVGQVAYNQCRGSVGNPVPTGLYCDDDVANIFGNPTPQPALTPRVSNPTRYRNLDAGRAAIGAFVIDTRTLANGLHTIAWGVIDSAGRTEGIGSRFFTVLNSGGADLLPTGDALAPGAAAALRAAPATARASAASLEALPFSTRRVWARTGFELSDPYQPLAPGGDGIRRLQLAPLGRLELRLGPVESGHLEANGTLRDLPPGSHLDPAAGSFTWTPGAGYIGAYRLVFVGKGERLPVVVTIRPVETAAVGEGEIRMSLDLPAPDQTVGRSFTVAGWALDPRGSIGSGIAAVHVWARRVDAPGVPAVFLGAADLDGARPDVARAFGGQFNSAGFGLAVSDLAPGRYEITAFVWNRRTSRWEDARTVRVVVRQ